jgi:hypothetical protein
MAEVTTGEWLLISLVWLVASFGSAALLAKLYKRLHPELSFHKLWAFWTVVLSLIAAGLFGLGII